MLLVRVGNMEKYHGVQQVVAKVCDVVKCEFAMLREMLSSKLYWVECVDVGIDQSLACQSGNRTGLLQLAVQDCLLV